MELCILLGTQGKIPEVIFHRSSQVMSSETQMEHDLMMGLDENNSADDPSKVQLILLMVNK